MKRECEEWLTAQFGDDRETIESVYAEYVESARQLLVELDEALASGDKARIDRVLHTIKGTAAMAGDMTLSSAAQAARANPDEAAIGRIRAAATGA